MKRQTLTFAAILMGGLALTVSCTKEPLFDIPEGAVMLTSENHVSHDKTSVYNTSVQWVGDGSESVTINDNPYTVHVSEGTAYILPGSDDDNPAIPSGSVFGHYGCESVTAPSGTPLTTTVTVPGTYDCSYDGNGRQILALPMVAYSPTLGGTIQFKQVTAAVRVMVRNEFSVTLALDSVVVSSNNYKLSGTVSVTLDAAGVDDPGVLYQTGSGKVKVNLNGTTILSGAIRDVQVPILPIGNGSVHPNITVKVYAHKDGDASHTYTYTTEVPSAEGLQLLRNQMFSAKCRMFSGNDSHVDDFDARATALTFEAIIANTKVRFTAASGLPINMDYSIDGGRTWNTYNSGTDITLANVGDKVLFRGHGTNTTLAQSRLVYSKFYISPNSGTRCYVYGNIMSLLYETNYSTATTLPDRWTFCSLFDGSRICLHPTKTLLLPATTLTNNCYCNMFRGSTITTAPELPATILSDSCYFSMFLGCRSLTLAPALPATTLAKCCYDHLFCDCTRLTSAPELPATSLANCDYCYEYMFYNCTSLVSAPALPATTLSRSCYECMFTGCTSLTSAPALPALTAERLCYRCMFKDCTSLRSAPQLPATTLAGTSCYASMFSGCTSLTVAPPSLPATTLSNYCYQDMFRGCTSLTTPPSISATTLAMNCCEEMFRDCTSLTTAPTLSATRAANYCYYRMFYGCTSLTVAPPTLSTTLANNCFQEMFYGCSSLTSAPELSAITLKSSCYYSMFQNCTNLTTAPILPAEALGVDNCYRSMFAGCSRLNSVTCLVTEPYDDWQWYYSTIDWLDGVASSGTFYKASSMTDWPSGISGIPENWTVVDY